MVRATVITLSGQKLEDEVLLKKVADSGSFVVVNPSDIRDHKRLSEIVDDLVGTEARSYVIWLHIGPEDATMVALRCGALISELKLRVGARSFISILQLSLIDKFRSPLSRH